MRWKHWQVRQAQQHGLCFLCRRPWTDPNSEHVVPLSRGGASTWRNQVITCGTCNAAKRNRHPTAVELMRLEMLNRNMDWTSI